MVGAVIAADRTAARAFEPRRAPPGLRRTTRAPGRGARPRLPRPSISRIRRTSCCASNSGPWSRSPRAASSPRTSRPPWAALARPAAWSASPSLGKRRSASLAWASAARVSPSSWSTLTGPRARPGSRGRSARRRGTRRGQAPRFPQLEERHAEEVVRVRAPGCALITSRRASMASGDVGPPEELAASSTASQKAVSLPGSLHPRPRGLVPWGSPRLPHAVAARRKVPRDQSRPESTAPPRPRSPRLRRPRHRRRDGPPRDAAVGEIAEASERPLFHGRRRPSRSGGQESRCRRSRGRRGGGRRRGE